MSCFNKQYSAIQLRRGLASEFQASNIVLASGEPAFATDEYIFKIGDGVTPWNNLDSLATLSYVDNLLSVNDAMIFKGTLGIGGTISSLPSIYETGWTYKVTTADTYAGNICEVGDLVIAIADRPSGGGNDADWVVAQTNLDLQTLPAIADPCDTEYILIQNSSRDTRVISISNLAQAISVIDGGGVIYNGC